nr:hypothetical protein [Tanacetum cinerariifolium]
MNKSSFLFLKKGAKGIKNVRAAQKASSQAVTPRLTQTTILSALPAGSRLYFCGPRVRLPGRTWSMWDLPRVSQSPLIRDSPSSMRFAPPSRTAQAETASRAVGGGLEVARDEPAGSYKLSKSSSSISKGWCEGTKTKHLGEELTRMTSSFIASTSTTSTSTFLLVNPNNNKYLNSLNPSRTKPNTFTCFAAKQQQTGPPVKKQQQQRRSNNKNKPPVKNKNGFNKGFGGDENEDDDFEEESGSLSTSKGKGKGKGKGKVRYQPLPLPKPPAGFLVDDQGRVIAVSDRRIATIVSDDEVESILPTASFALAKIHMHLVYSGFCYTARGGSCYTEDDIFECRTDLTDSLHPSGMWVTNQRRDCGFKYELRHTYDVSDDEVESILPTASFALAKIHMHLIYSGFCYTARGGFCYTEDDIFECRTDDGQDLDGLPTEGVEITCFQLDGSHYMIYTPSDPLLFVAVK